VNALNKAGSTPLRMAIESKRLSVVLILVDNGADLVRVYTNGRTALHYAVEGGDKEIVTALLAKRIDVNAKDARGTTPLLLAASKNVDIVTALISKGADVNARDTNGWTPLMEAAGANSSAMASILIANGADVTARDKDGWSALKQALLSGCIRTVEKIKQAGAVE